MKVEGAIKRTREARLSSRCLMAGPKISSLVSVRVPLFHHLPFTYFPRLFLFSFPLSTCRTSSISRSCSSAYLSLFPFSSPFLFPFHRYFCFCSIELDQFRKNRKFVMRDFGRRTKKERRRLRK